MQIEAKDKVEATVKMVCKATGKDEAWFNGLVFGDGAKVVAATQEVLGLKLPKDFPLSSE
jgi:hypothetical protein